jgi:amino acid transporter
MRKVARVVSILLLLATGYLGISNGIRELGDGETGLQRSVTFAVLLYGVLGLLGALGLLRKRPWSVAVTAAWTLSVMWAATVASFAFHDPALQERETLYGMAAAFVSTALFGWLVVWTARSDSRVPPSPESTHIPRP